MTVDVITGIGHHLPARVVSSGEVEARVNASSSGFTLPRGTIRLLTGVRNRHYADDGCASSDLAAAAARKALDAAELDSRTVDVVIFTSASHDVSEPATANLVQHKLGCTGASVFDVKNACNSFLNGVDIAHSFIETGRAARVLLASGEVLSPTINWSVRDNEDLTTKFAALTLGDGGGACVLEARPDGGESGLRRGQFLSDGAQWELSTVLAGGTLMPGDFSQRSFECRSTELHLLALEYLPDLIRKVLKDLDWEPGDIDLVAPHQVSLSIIEAICQQVGLERDRCQTTLTHVGNTAAASIPIALNTAVDAGRLEKGAKVLLVGGARIQRGRDPGDLVTTVLDLLEDATGGPGTVIFLPSAPDPQPIASLWRHSEDAARWLAHRVGSDTAVGMVLASTPACAAAMFGAWRSGLTVASLPTSGRGMDEVEYVEQLKRLCPMVGAEVLLTDSAHVHLFLDSGLRVHAFDDVLAGGPSRAPNGVGDLVQSTSGSTGSSKGVKLSLAAVAANINSILDRLQPPTGTVACSWLPLSYDMGLIGMFLSALVSGSSARSGGSLVLIAPETFMANPSVWLKACSCYGATITTAPNFAFELATRTARWRSNLDLSSLRIVITGAERVRGQTLRRFSDAVAGAGFDPLALCPAYSLAEATLAVSIVSPSVSWASRFVDPLALAEGDWVEVEHGSGTELVSNRPALPRVGVRIAGATDGVGEIEVAGPSMLDDYVGADLRLSDDGWFPTKDLGRIVNGELYVTGRLDDMLVIGGRNFYASDLEHAGGRVDLVRAGSCAVINGDDGHYVVVAKPRRKAGDGAVLEEACRSIKTEVTRMTGSSAATVLFVERGRCPRPRAASSSGTWYADPSRRDGCRHSHVSTSTEGVAVADPGDFAKQVPIVVEALSRHLQAHFAIGDVVVTEHARLDYLGFSSLEVIEVLVSFREAIFGDVDDDDLTLPAEPFPLDTLGDVASMMLSQAWLTPDDIAMARTGSDREDPNLTSAVGTEDVGT
jgi:3-oxoacyl-(acyl-carrier-protein) synthase III